MKKCSFCFEQSEFDCLVCDKKICAKCRKGVFCEICNAQEQIRVLKKNTEPIAHNSTIPYFIKEEVNDFETLPPNPSNLDRKKHVYETTNTPLIIKNMCKPTARPTNLTEKGDIVLQSIEKTLHEMDINLLYNIVRFYRRNEDRYLDIAEKHIDQKITNQKIKQTLNKFLRIVICGEDVDISDIDPNRSIVPAPYQKTVPTPARATKSVGGFAVKRRY